MLRDTTSRGLYVRVWPPHTSERRAGEGEVVSKKLPLPKNMRRKRNHEHQLAIASSFDYQGTISVPNIVAGIFPDPFTTHFKSCTYPGVRAGSRIPFSGRKEQLFGKNRGKRPILKNPEAEHKRCLCTTRRLGLQCV